LKLPKGFPQALGKAVAGALAAAVANKIIALLSPLWLACIALVLVFHRVLTTEIGTPLWLPLLLGVGWLPLGVLVVLLLRRTKPPEFTGYTTDIFAVLPEVRWRWSYDPKKFNVIVASIRPFCRADGTGLRVQESTWLHPGDRKCHLICETCALNIALEDYRTRSEVQDAVRRQIMLQIDGQRLGHGRTTDVG